MNLQPLLDAPLLIRVHAMCALSALILGTAQFIAPKGTLPHRTLGYIWVTLMATVAATSFWVQTLRPGHFSVIHLLSIYVLAVLPIAVMHARRHRIGSHRRAMIGLFVGGLIIAGAFTLLPGRIMGHVVFG
jgi:uncharacterized membrane protein